MSLERGIAWGVGIEAFVGGVVMGLYTWNPNLLMAGAMLAACVFFYCLGRAFLPKGVKVRIQKPTPTLSFTQTRFVLYSKPQAAIVLRPSASSAFGTHR